jgi:hypothetical protein
MMPLFEEDDPYNNPLLYTNWYYYMDKYGVEYLRTSFIGVDISAAIESKYLYNGVNYFFVVMANETEGWRVAEFASGHLTLVEMYAPNDETAQMIIKARHKGQILNAAGEEIGRN